MIHSSYNPALTNPFAVLFWHHNTYSFPLGKPSCSASSKCNWDAYISVGIFNQCKEYPVTKVSVGCTNQEIGFFKRSWLHPFSEKHLHKKLHSHPHRPTQSVQGVFCHWSYSFTSQKIGVYTSAHDKLLPEESTYIPPTPPPPFHKTSFPTRHELQIHINTTSADFNPNSLNYKTISQIPPLPQNKSTLAKAN